MSSSSSSGPETLGHAFARRYAFNLLCAKATFADKAPVLGGEPSATYPAKSLSFVELGMPSQGSVWVQLGTYRSRLDGTTNILNRIYMEVATGTTPVPETNRYYTNMISGPIEFEIRFDNTTGVIRGYVNSSIPTFTHTNTNIIGKTFDHITVSGEVLGAGTHIAGTNNNRQTFSSIGMQRTNDIDYVSAGFTSENLVVTWPDLFGINLVDGSTIQIWDKR
jgi:hypothetical protein